MTTKTITLTVQEKILKLDELAIKYNEGLSVTKAPFSAAIQTASAMNDLRELMTEDVMSPMMQLMNSPLGFLTDRDPNKTDREGKRQDPYHWKVVRDCLIEGMLRGFAPVGNELNIIASRFYAAKSGLRRRVTQFPGIADFRDAYDVPRSSDKGAIVKCRATWQIDGKTHEIEREFAIKGYPSTLLDAYVGKAERKLLHAVFQRLTGQNIPAGEVTDNPLDGRGPDNAKPAQVHTVTKPTFSDPAPEITEQKEGETVRSPSGEIKAVGEEETPALAGAQHPDHASGPGEPPAAQGLHADLAQALSDLDFKQERFVAGLRLLDVKGIAKQAKVVDDLSFAVCETVFREGLDGVIQAIEGREGK